MKPVFPVLLVLSLLCVQCEVFLDDPPSCHGAVAHFYTQGCTFVGSDGESWSQSYSEQIICTSYKESAETTKCEEEYYKWIRCCRKLELEDCNGCDHLYEEFSTCVQSSTYYDTNDDDYYDGDDYYNTDDYYDTDF